MSPGGGKGRGEKGKKWGIPSKFKLVFILTREAMKKRNRVKGFVIIIHWLKQIHAVICRQVLFLLNAGAFKYVQAHGHTHNNITICYIQKSELQCFD